MSANIKELRLDGKSKTLTRARAQRLVDAGSHAWQGRRTIREKLSPKEVPAFHSCMRWEPTYFFDFDYPDQGDGTLKPEGYHIPPYTYPLPYDLLKHYQGRNVSKRGKALLPHQHLQLRSNLPDPKLVIAYDEYVKWCETRGMSAASFDIWKKETRTIPELKVIE